MVLLFIYNIPVFPKASIPASCSTRLEKMAVWPSRAASPSQSTKSQRTGGLITHLPSGKANPGETQPKSSQHRAMGPLQPCHRSRRSSLCPIPQQPPQGSTDSPSGDLRALLQSPSLCHISAAARHTAGPEGKDFFSKTNPSWKRKELGAEQARPGTLAKPQLRAAAGTGSNTEQLPCSSHARRAPPPKPPLPGAAVRNAACLQAAVLALSSPAETLRVGGRGSAARAAPHRQPPGGREAPRPAAMTPHTPPPAAHRSPSRCSPARSQSRSPLPAAPPRSRPRCSWAAAVLRAAPPAPPAP